MSEVLILSQETIGRVLTMSDAIRGVEEAYCQKSTGAGSLFPLVCHVFEPERADLDIKSGHLAKSGIYGLKLVSWFGDNEAKGLPALFGTTLLFDDSTGCAGGAAERRGGHRDAHRERRAPWGQSTWPGKSPGGC